MRLTILGLLLCTGIPAFCQSGASAPPSPYAPGQTSLVVTPPARDFSKLPPGWHPTSVAPRKIVIQPQVPATRRLDNAQIDPKMIVHPPQSSIGVQPPGTAVAQNEYPHLQVLPIESPNSILKSIPTKWPRFQLETIPTQWPRFSLGGIPAPATSAKLDLQPTLQLGDALRP
jgi:hypothetical protein